MLRPYVHLPRDWTCHAAQGDRNASALLLPGYEPRTPDLPAEPDAHQATASEREESRFDTAEILRSIGWVVEQQSLADCSPFFAADAHEVSQQQDASRVRGPSGGVLGEDAAGPHAPPTDSSVILNSRETPRIFRAYASMWEQNERS